MNPGNSGNFGNSRLGEPIPELVGVEKVTQEWEHAQNFPWESKHSWEKRGWKSGSKSPPLFLGIFLFFRDFKARERLWWGIKRQNIPWNLRIILKRATMTRWKSFGKASGGTDRVAAFLMDHKWEKFPFFPLFRVARIYIFNPSFPFFIPKGPAGNQGSKAAFLFLKKKNLKKSGGGSSDPLGKAGLRCKTPFPADSKLLIKNSSLKPLSSRKTNFFLFFSQPGFSSFWPPGRTKPRPSNFTWNWFFFLGSD